MPVAMMKRQKPAGEDVLATSGPEETKKIIQTILNEK